MTVADVLHSLRPEGVRLITPELMDGRRDRWEASAWEGLLEPLPRPIELAPCARTVSELIRGFSKHDTALDAAAAESLHRALPLTRREAAASGVWRFLSVVAFPQLVRHRWENNSAATMRSRFSRSGTRPDSNAFSRWWWIAELTRDGDDYALTHRAFSRAPLATAIFVRSLSFYRPAVEACLTVLDGEPADVVERVMFELSRWLALVPLEGLMTEQLEEKLRSLVRGRR